MPLRSGSRTGMMSGFRPRMAGQEGSRGFATDDIAASARRIGLTSSIRLNPGKATAAGETPSPAILGEAGKNFTEKKNR
jgi:hypothetical protein